MTAALLAGGAALVGGLLVAAQGPIYARLAAGLGGRVMLAVCLAFLLGACVTGALALASGGLRGLTAAGLGRALGAVPAWVWLGGLFGACQVAISMQAIPVLGAMVFLLLVVTGNLVGAALYDHLGAFGLEIRSLTPQRLAGLGLVLAGVAVTVWR